MAQKEAAARIKINKLLEAAGWRFFPENGQPANIRLEQTTTLKPAELDAYGDDFEKASKGFIDFLLLDAKGKPLVVLEAKSEDKNPLVGKEQARKYARSQDCRFVILSNGNLHYFWDLDRGNPAAVTAFPTAESLLGNLKFTPDPDRLPAERVDADYIVLTQRPSYASEAGWSNEGERDAFIRANRLRFLRDYQIRAVRTIQDAVKKGKDRFLFEMATGTGKTLTAGAVVKLFLRTGNASRVLFLVDRLELEEQAKKALVDYLKNDYSTVVYKENRDDWRRADIVVSTVQSLLFNNKYQRLFSPTDFDLVISDEAHRSIGGNARAVFDYFIGYKLGLTATPRDYLRARTGDDAPLYDPRETERRILLDTYRTFGCESATPTFRYSLLDGVKDGFLINPTVVDARTEVTTQLLSEQGFTVTFTDDTGEDREESYKQREFEKRFFSDATNILFCKTFLENALRDPVSGEIGKSIVYAVSQNHAAKLAQILNEIADRMFPGRYHSDFAVQVTSSVPEAQQFTIQFANNNLLGSGNFMPSYRTSKARVCVTVGMMTTGYDCTDLLNLGLFRPVFSPTDFIQIKGRGTRRHDFREHLADPALKAGVEKPEKAAFKLFDFFATCEYFETEFDYDEEIALPRPGGKLPAVSPDPRPPVGDYDHLGADILASIKEEVVGPEGMLIDRRFFDRFEETVRDDAFVRESVETGQWDRALDYVHREILDRPEDFFTLEKLRRAVSADRRLSLREILEKIFGLIPRFKSKDELLEEEFAKFAAVRRPEDDAAVLAIRQFFKAYITNDRVRGILESGNLAELNATPGFTMREFREVPAEYRRIVPEYVKDFVPLNQFLS